MDSNYREFRQGSASIATAIAFIVGGLVLASYPVYGLVTGEPVMFSTGSHGTGTRYVGSPLDILWFLVACGICTLVGLIYLVWCVNARVILEPEGIVIKNMFGNASARIPWEEVTAIERVNPYRGRPYNLLRTTTNRYRLSGYRDLDDMLSEISRRTPNARVAADLGD